MVRKCDEALQRIAFFEGIYCYSLEEIEDLIRLTYPAVSDEQIAGWIARGGWNPLLGQRRTLYRIDALQRSSPTKIYRYAIKLTPTGFYYYVLNNIDYAFAALPKPNLSISTNGGMRAQSMHFVAMCRTLGIPGRSTGGFCGLTKNTEVILGRNFLLNYGWISVDTSAVQICQVCKDLTEAERNAFVDYLFGSREPMRCVVQKDTDAPFIP